MTDSYHLYMVRYFLDISYRGTAFSGWQIQSNAVSVQSEVEMALSTIMQTPLSIVGSGRTDAGVHGTQQIAHLDCEGIADPPLLRYKLNSYLGDAISINDIYAVKDGAHARFDATARTYHYLIHQQKNPFKQGLSYYFIPKLDVDLINQGAEIIQSWQNFECFSKVHTEVSHFNCDIFGAHWSEKAGDHVFEVTANRFLRGMVRAMVGTLLDVGLGKTTLDQLQHILESNDRSKAGRAVPPEGLYLMKVAYPEGVRR